MLKDGDYIIMPGTEKKYEISDDVKETVQGVYNINKGYAVFREVNIVDQNEEFCIVNPENAYGLSAILHCQSRECLWAFRARPDCTGCFQGEGR